MARAFTAILTAMIVAAALAFASYKVPVVVSPDAPPKSRNWPMFGGTPQRNLANPFEKNLPAKWSVDPEKRKNIKWVVDLGSKAYGGPVIADGRIFVGTNNQKPRDKKWIAKDGYPIDLGVIMCFRESDGKFLWQAVHEKLPGGQVIDWPREGIASSPVVEDNRLYYVSNRCEVVCADVTNGKAIWKLDMIAKLGVFPHNLSTCSPLLVGDHLRVVTSNGVNEDHLNVPAPQAPSFIKVDKKTGNVLWQDNSPTAALLNPANAKLKDFFKTLVNRAELLSHGQWSNPAFDVVNGTPQVIFPGGDGWIYSFTLEGKLIWKFDGNPKDAKYALKTGERSDFIGTPVIYKNRVYIGVGQDPENKSGIGHLWCIDMSKAGDVSPELVTDNTVFPPKTKKNANSAAVWHYGGVIAAQNVRQKLRRNYYFGRTMSTCAIHDDIVYISDLDGVLHCLDANTGKVHWEHNTRSESWSSPYYADGKIYFGTDDSDVFVFRACKQKNLLATIEIGGRIRTPPVANNGVLYIQTENRLYAIAADK